MVRWWAWLAAVGAVECQPLAAAHNGATADIINYDSSQTLHTTTAATTAVAGAVVVVVVWVSSRGSPPLSLPPRPG